MPKNNAKNNNDLRKTNESFSIAFIHAPDPIYADTQNYGAQFMPVWAYTLASHISNDMNYEILLFDTRFQAISSIKRADIFLFSGMNQDCGSMENVRSQLKLKYCERCGCWIL